MPHDEAEQAEVRRFSACTSEDCKAIPAYWYNCRDGEVAICAAHGAEFAKIVQEEGGYLHLIPLHEHEIGSPGDPTTTQEGDSDAQVSEGDEAG